MSVITVLQMGLVIIVFQMGLVVTDGAGCYSVTNVAGYYSVTKGTGCYSVTDGDGCYSVTNQRLREHPIHLVSGNDLPSPRHIYGNPVHCCFLRRQLDRNLPCAALSPLQRCGSPKRTGVCRYTVEQVGGVGWCGWRRD